MTATALTHFLAATETATPATMQVVTAFRSAALRGNRQSRARRYVRCFIEAHMKVPSEGGQGDRPFLLPKRRPGRTHVTKQSPTTT